MKGIYYITNTVNNKKYIGSSNDIKRRWHAHKTKLTKNKHINGHLQNAWNHYGADKFKFELIESVEDIAQLFEVEQKYLDIAKQDPDNYYNATFLTPKYKVKRLSDEARKKLAEKMRGNKLGLGYKHTEEAKIKIGQASKGNQHAKGHKLSDEHKAAISKASKGNKYAAGGTWMLGRKLSEETRRKIGEASKGRKHTEEWKQNMREKMLGNQHAKGNKGPKQYYAPS